MLNLSTGSQDKVVIDSSKHGETGWFRVSGASLSVVAAGGSNFDPTKAIVLIDNDLADPISGVFAGAAAGKAYDLDGQQFYLTYTGGTGNDVALYNNVPTIDKGVAIKTQRKTCPFPTLLQLMHLPT